MFLPRADVHIFPEQNINYDCDRAKTYLNHIMLMQQDWNSASCFVGADTLTYLLKQ